MKATIIIASALIALVISTAHAAPIPDTCTVTEGAYPGVLISGEVNPDGRMEYRAMSETGTVAMDANSIDGEYHLVMPLPAAGTYEITVSRTRAHGKAGPVLVATCEFVRG